MEGYNNQQLVQILKLFYQSGCSVQAVYCNRYKRSIENKRSVKVDQRRNARSAKNITTVRKNVQSITYCSQELDLSQTTTYPVLRLDLDPLNPT